MYVRALKPRGTYATVGGPEMRKLFTVLVSGWVVRLGTPCLDERFDAGQLVPVIDGPYKPTEAREAFRHFGAGHLKGKVVIRMD